MAAAEQSAHCAGASPQECCAAVLDFESYPTWQSAVNSVEVRERRDDSAVVAFEVDAKVKRVSYVLRYHFDEVPRRIWWEYLEGDVRDVSGEYVFEPDGDGTLAVYRLELDAGRFLPGPVKKVLSDQVMKRSVQELAQRVGR